MSTIVILEGRGKEMSGTKIKVKDNETLDSALKRFKRLCNKDGVSSEWKKRQHYEKPSDRKKRKAAEAARKRKYRR